MAADASTLKPPPGVRVAVAVFQDLECQECAAAYPLVSEAAEAHKIPVVLYDFPLPRHNWSFDAAVWARYFDLQNAAGTSLGNDFRRFVFANQRQITRENLQQWVQRFADEHKVAVPAIPDPAGKLAERVKADFALGQRLGVEHTPTIWVIGNGVVSQPLVEEIKDRAQLNQIIEDMLRKAPPPQETRKPAAKKSVPARTHKTSKQGVKQ
jgi:protein-disulfide isomerase